MPGLFGPAKAQDRRAHGTPGTVGGVADEPFAAVEQRGAAQRAEHAAERTDAAGAAAARALSCAERCDV